MKRITMEIMLVPILFLLSMAFAWIPMLGWNLGVIKIWTNMPPIDYFTAFWFSFALSYLKTSVITIKE